MNTAHSANFDPLTSRQSLTDQVEDLLARFHPEVPVERRRDIRYPIPALFSLTPLDADRHPIKEEAVTVVGKNISRRGMSFYHERPLPHRRALITLVDPNLGSFSAEIDVSWCRFRRPGWYESGGRLVRTIGTLNSTDEQLYSPGAPPNIESSIEEEPPGAGD